MEMFNLHRKPSQEPFKITRAQWVATHRRAAGRPRHPQPKG
jgi:hypothetical protein